jgi:hypothetical protein
MNQDQVKQKLLDLDGETGDFSVIFTGKKSRKVDGLYYPDRKEIIIHNKNFTTDDQLIYTAIHEFAHHVQHVRSAEPLSTRAHTVRFWNIFHTLLFAAEKKGIYSNIFKREPRFTDLTRTIRDNLLSANGDLMKELGRLLTVAYDLCRELNASFEDYVDRELLLHRNAARMLMKIHGFGIRPEIGFENMKTVARISDDSLRVRAEEAFADGNTPDMVKAGLAESRGPGGSLDLLMRERERIERSIHNLTRRLTAVEKKINELKRHEAAT